jgi:hypothetical protein
LTGEQGRIFREAWIAGVTRHYPGEPKSSYPKSSYIAPWGPTPGWERESAAAVYDQVRAFIEATGGNTAKLTRSQKGRFVALCWVGQYSSISRIRSLATWQTGMTCRDGSKKLTRTFSSVSGKILDISCKIFHSGATSKRH